MMIKFIIFLCRISGINVFTNSKGEYNIVSKHAVERIKTRMSYRHLLKLASETVLANGNKSVHFDYYNNQKTEHAKLYKGYIYVFGSNNELITCYSATNITDLLVTRN